MQKRKITQISLLSIGVLLVLFTYFFYPTVNKEKFMNVETLEEKLNLQEEIDKLEVKEKNLLKKIEETKNLLSLGKELKKDALKNLKEDLNETLSQLDQMKTSLNKGKRMEATDGDENNTFKNVEYEGFYDLNNPFTVKATDAYFDSEEPDIVYMSNMHVTLHLKDNRIVIITSDKGKYNKVTYDCYFVDNVKATDGETIILSKNLDLLASQDAATIYNEVYLTDERGSLRADKVDYDFNRKYYNISMFSINKKVEVKLTQ